MRTPPDLLAQIRRLHFEHGLAAALAFTRVAFERGHVGPEDITEIFLALHSCSWRRLEDSGRLPRPEPARSLPAA